VPDSDRIDLALVRQFALALPGATEEPHFDMTSFRVRGKIFATATPDDMHLHVFVDEPEVSAAVGENPAVFEPLLWGRKVRGVRVSLPGAPAERVRDLIEESWRRKAPARLVTELDRAGPGSRPGQGTAS
jgi:hypothetical protein